MNQIIRAFGICLLLAAGSMARASTEWSAQDYDLYAGDFDGDGYSDILYVAKDPSKPSGIVRADQNGALTIGWQTWASNYLNINWAGNAYNIIVADFNGDGKADIFLQSVAPGGNSFLLLTSSAGFVVGISQNIGNTNLGVTGWSADQHHIVAGAFAGSVNGHPKADLFLQATSPSGTNYVVLSDSGGTFTTAPSQHWTDSTGPGGFKWSTKSANVYAGDFNGDGYADLLIQAKPNFVMIDYDVPFPVPTYPPNMNGVVLAQSTAPIFASAGVRQWSRMSNGVDWSPGTNNIVIGSNGANKAIVILQARLSGKTSYELIGNASGPIFPATATALNSNINLSADSNRVIAGNFGKSATSTGLYYQALTAAGTNYQANSIGSTGTIVASAQNPSGATGTVVATAVGRTEGTFAVTNTGNATYSIPIVVPPGIAGIQPKIAIAYQSGSANGLLGVGWGLSGFSEIQRCKKTLAEDGVNGTPQLVAADDYCLDGQKLRYTGGSAYGTAGSTYQTEMDNFSRVTAYSNGGLASLGPGYFTAQTKDGLTYEYGRMGGAYDNALTPSEWLLDKVSDRSGNYMTISYTASSAGVEPSLIAYTSNDTAGVQWAYIVIFNYETRATSDVLSRASLSGPNRTTDRLKSIQTMYNGATLRQYNLTYKNTGSSPNTRLSAVQECDAGGNCLLPTTINWQDGQIGVGNDNIVNIGSLAQYAIPIDVNGDGRADVVYPAPGAGGNWMIMFASPAGGYTLPATNTQIPHNGNYASALAIDYNADGKMDLIVPAANGNWQILQSTGTGFSVVSTNYQATGAGGQAWAADVNGDGYPDLVFADASSTHLLARLNSATGLSPTITTLYTTPANATIATPSTASYYAFNLASNTQGDFNGDGRTDLMIGLNVLGVPTPKILLSTGSTFVDSGYVFADTQTNGASVVLSTWRAVDANGDGYTDVAFVDGSGVWKVAYGGPGTTAMSQVVGSSVSMTAGTATSGLGVTVADWDGDGRADVLWATTAPNTSGPWEWNRSTGDTLNQVSGGTGAMTGPTNTSVTTAQMQTAFADVNGDGLQDIVYGDTSGNWHYRLRQGLYPDLVNSIADGFGNSVTWIYAALTDSAVYTASGGAKFPNVDLQVPFYVVKQYKVTDSIGGSFDVTEQFAGARFNFQGRGFEGFSSRSETDGRTGITTTTTFDQDFPEIGLVLSTTSKQSNGKIISQTNYHYTDLVTNSAAFNDRHYPYADTVTTTTNEVNPGDPTDGLPIVQLTTATTVDGYGTPLTITETTYDLTNSSAMARIVAKSYGSPANDVANWCLGFVTNQAVTNTVPGLAAQTRTVQYTKDSDATKCRVYQKILEPNDPSPYRSKLTTTYLYDTFGHVNNETVSGAGFANRVTQTGYGTQGVFALQVTNAAGEVTKKSFDYASGVPLTATDANGIVLTSYYDSFGRKYKEVRPDGTYTTWSLYACNNSNAYCGDGLLRYEVQEQQFNTAGNLVRYAVQMFDSMGRAKYVQSQVLTGALATVATAYDNFGRIQKKSLPYLAGGTQYWTTSLYDILGRQLSETRQINQSNTGSQSVLYRYKRLLHTYTDANNGLTQKQFNAIGQVASVTDALSIKTSYQYDPFGNLLSTQDPAGNAIVNTYNLRGFKLTTTDPDLGAWGYQYYPTGELNIQTDAKTQTVTFAYDGIGRTASRTELEGVTTWNYGTAATSTPTNRNIGKLVSVSSPGGYSESYAYDSLGRSQGITTNANASSYAFTNGYDTTTGLLATVTYPTSTSAVTNSRFEVQYDYAYGQLKDIRDFYTPATVYWQANATDAAGRMADEQYGNGLHTLSNYDAVTGWISSRTTGTSAQIQNLTYQWDKVGNLVERKDAIDNLTEDFTKYDALNRLVTSTLNNAPNLSLTYDPSGIGNIQNKSDVGAYSYATACGGTAHVHAVTSAGSNSYCYDKNGNMTSRNGSAITWYSYNLPNQINQGNSYSQFSYGAGRGRYKEVSYVAPGGTLPTGTETTIFVNGMFEQVTKPSGVIEYKHYIVAGNAPIAIRTFRSSGANDTRYLHKDHLGSVDTITDESGAWVQRLSYDAFGKRRAATTWVGSPSPTDWTNIAAMTHRGFTFHEQLDDVGLIHMNGRVYDPTIGRFISADPTIPAPYMSQSLNRYSYVINNPLSMVDPTGFGFLSDLWDAVVGFVRFAAPMIVAFIAYAYGAPYFSQLLSTTGALAPGTITLAGATVAGGLSSALGAAFAGAGLRGSLRAGMWGAVGSWIGYQVREGVSDAAAGGGDEKGLYDVHKEDGGISIDRLTGSPTSSTIFVNGMANNLKTAAAYALQMTGGSDVTLFYNPTHGFIADLTESIIMKFTGQSALGDQLAQILQSGDYTAVVAHSQGTLIVSNALSTLGEEGFTFDNGLSVTYYGSAANQYVAKALADSVGASFDGVFDSPFDAVGNVVGGNTFNPFRMIGSILASPTLFMKQPISPHSCYPACAQ